MNELRENLEADPPGTADALSSWVAEQLVGLMVEHGVPVRQQANLLSELCGLSLSQARRKLRGAMWSFGEVLAVTRRFGASLDQVFSDSPGDGVAHTVNAADVSSVTLQDATFVMGSLAVPCRVRLGALIVGDPAEDELLTAQNDTGWYVGTREQLHRHRIKDPWYVADLVVLTPVPNKPRVRIAILDDDIGTTETLGDWFNATGYAAQAFTTGEQLLASQIDNHDAFIVDFMLAGGDSSQEIIRKIRQALPEAPIVLLTGKLRSGQVSEADVATMLRTSNVTLFEKPVRPSVLAATIEKELDRLANRLAC